MDQELRKRLPNGATVWNTSTGIITEWLSLLQTLRKPTGVAFGSYLRFGSISDNGTGLVTIWMTLYTDTLTTGFRDIAWHRLHARLGFRFLDFVIGFFLVLLRYQTTWDSECFWQVASGLENRIS